MLPAAAGMHQNLSRNPAVLAVVLAAYFALGKAGAALGGVSGVSATWPASGFALVAMLLLGRSIWPAVFAGAFLEHTASSGQIASSITVAVGSTAEAWIGAWLVERLAGGRNVLARAETVFRFIAIAAFASTPLSAAAAVTARTLIEHAPWADVTYIVLTSWLAHLAGILVVAPFLMLWVQEPFTRGRWLAMFEGVIVLAMIVGAAMVVFGGQFPFGVQNYPLEFLCVPLILWITFRFGRRETASAILLLCGIAVWGTLHGLGPFVRDSQNEALVLVQAYTSVMAITGLLLASSVAERKDAEGQLRQLATTDSLTGLANYRQLIEVLRAEIARSHRTHRPFSVVFIDMNGLKKINDRLGHLVGSRSIVRVATAIKGAVRVIDTPARFGGDEFAVVLPETPEEGGQVVLERIHERLAADAQAPLLSVSGGVAVFPRDGDSPTMLLRAADKLLYAAKMRAVAIKKAAADSASVARTGTLF